MYKVIARHKWLIGCTITESYNPQDETHRRFTATIRKWQNWKIWEGKLEDGITEKIRIVVMQIRDKIDAGDEKKF